jgi:hypothetical protein
VASILALKARVGHRQACGATPINGLLLTAQRHGLRAATRWLSPNKDNPPMESHPQPQQIRLDTDRMKTIYANFFALAGTPEELVLYLGATSPLPSR